MKCMQSQTANTIDVVPVKKRDQQAAKQREHTLHSQQKNIKESICSIFLLTM